MTRKYDAIIVGSGLGGLSAAANLAKSGLKVGVFEKHTQPGGYATTFFKDRFEFEVSLHALSGVGTEDNRGPLYEDFKRLGVADKVEFLPLDNLYTSVSGSSTLRVPSGYENAIKTFEDKFPEEGNGFRSLLSEIESIGDELQIMTSGKYSRNPAATVARFPHVARAAGLSVSTILDRHISNAHARLAFMQLWGYFGLPPERLSLLMFAAGLHAYLKYGSVTIKDKSQSLSNAFVEVIEEAGGDVFTGKGIVKILVEDGHVRGILTEDGEEFFADIVVAGANPISVCTEMIDSSNFEEDFLNRLTSAKPSS